MTKSSQEHRYPPLTPENYESLRSVRANGGRINMNLLQRSIDELLHLRDTIERLRNLQPQHITEEQRTEWLWAWSLSREEGLHRDMMASAVRVMLKEV